jgi:hypothetical protein
MCCRGEGFGSRFDAGRCRRRDGPPGRADRRGRWRRHDAPAPPGIRTDAPVRHRNRLVVRGFHQAGRHPRSPRLRAHRLAGRAPFVVGQPAGIRHDRGVHQRPANRRSSWRAPQGAHRLRSCPDCPCDAVSTAAARAGAKTSNRFGRTIQVDAACNDSGSRRHPGCWSH